MTKNIIEYIFKTLGADQQTRVSSWKSEADKTDFLKFSEIKLVTSRAQTVKAKQHENISNETALMTNVLELS